MTKNISIKHISIANFVGCLIESLCGYLSDWLLKYLEYKDIINQILYIFKSGNDINTETHLKSKKAIISFIIDRKSEIFIEIRRDDTTEWKSLYNTYCKNITKSVIKIPERINMIYCINKIYKFDITKYICIFG